MRKDEGVDIGHYEKAIAEKYGDEAVQNPRGNWDEKKEKEFDVEGLLEGIAGMLQPYTEEIKELKEELSVLTSRFNEVADEPAAKKVSNTFSQEANNKQTTAEARFERLVALRHGRK